MGARVERRRLLQMGDLVARRGAGRSRRSRECEDGGADGKRAGHTAVVGLAEESS